MAVTARSSTASSPATARSSLPTDQGGKATTQYRGVAPNANIISLKVLDSHGEGRASAMIAAIAWAINHRQQYNIRVMNISVEGDVTTPAAYDPLDRAVDAAWRAGIVVVCAAGNEGAFGEGGVLSPGNDPYAITVGASDSQQTADTSDDTVCTYSSVGPTLFDEYAKPDLVAPGNHIISLRAPGSWIDDTYPQTRVAVSTYQPGASNRATPSYAVMSGTSAAAPVVAGAAALMIQNDATLTPGEVKLRLMDSAHQLAGAAPDSEGAGGSTSQPRSTTTRSPAATTSRPSSATAARSCRSTYCCSGRSTPGRSTLGRSTRGRSTRGRSTPGPNTRGLNTHGQNTHGRS